MYGGDQDEFDHLVKLAREEEFDHLIKQDEFDHLVKLANLKLAKLVYSIKNTKNKTNSRIQKTKQILHPVPLYKWKI